MNYAKKAKELFLEGYNCSQSLVLAFEDKVDLPRATLAKIASSFGGGMGRMREVCGCVSGMLIVAGLYFGYSSSQDDERKKEHYALVQRLINRFKVEYGSITCSILLHVQDEPITYVPEKRSKEYYKKRPCLEMIVKAALIINEEIEKDEKRRNPI